MAMQYDGKTYRNLQEQVAYLTGKWQELANEIDELRAQIPSKMIVEELPEEGDPLITYYVGPMGTAPNQYYEVWIWVQEEPDGPFVWRELEDTDQVDLSGYLQKQTAETTYPQAYVKNTNGSQTMMEISRTSPIADSLVLRTENGQVTTAAPTADNHAANKKYVDDYFVAKQTAVTSSNQAYAKAADGSQTMQDISTTGSGDIIARQANGQIYVPSSPSANNDATSKKYVDDTFLAKLTGTTLYDQAYRKNTDGSQSMVFISVTGAVAWSLAQRNGDGQIVCADPTASNQAATKNYVDAAVGQLLYLHDIEIIVTVDATNKLYIKAYLINGNSTAITSIDRTTFKRMDVQYGAFGPNLANVNTCAVTKCPDSLRQDEFDEPFPAYLYQYISGGSLVSGQTTNAMTITVTDSVITF